MPRVKKFRFTKRSSVVTFPNNAMLSKNKSPSSVPPPAEQNGQLEHDQEEGVATQSSSVGGGGDVPKLCCVVCYNEFPYYTLTCAPWESAVTRDFYVALNIPEDDAVAGLPFCPECHSKVAVMFSLHQQLQNVLQNFNCIRNDVAFCIVDSIGKNCRKGPLDLIRQQIYTRWKDLHDKAKAVRSSDVYDPISTLSYLTPKLSVADEFPADPSTISISGAAKQRLGQLRQTPASLLLQRSSNNNLTGLAVAQDKRRQSGRGSTSNTTNTREVSIVEHVAAAISNGKNRLGMPKLEPMAKPPPPTSAAAAGPALRRGGLGFGQSRIGKGTRKFGRGGLLRHHKQKSVVTTTTITGSKSKQGESKKSQQINKASKFQLANHFKPNPAYRKKAPKRLPGGLWKCNYCPVTFSKSVSVSQHESRAHPETRPYLCTMCSCGFLTHDGVRKHLQAMHKEVVEGYVKCPYCPRHFAREPGYQHHISTMHKGKEIPDFDAALKAANSNATGVAGSSAKKTLRGKNVKKVVKQRKPGGGRKKKVVVVEEVVKVVDPLTP